MDGRPLAYAAGFPSALVRMETGVKVRTLYYDWHDRWSILTGMDPKDADHAKIIDGEWTLVEPWTAEETKQLTKYGRILSQEERDAFATPALPPGSVVAPDYREIMAEKSSE